ncbi:MAG: hypothetical protein JWP40_4785 [Blastococcus sp.]|nr:hypothetical protein [Blastococcus sp.]
MTRTESLLDPGGPGPCAPGVTWNKNGGDMDQAACHP